MKARRCLTALLAVMLLLVAASSATAAEGDLPTGQARGVAIDWRHGGSMVVVFKRSAGLYRRVAGKKTTVACWHLSASGRAVGDGGGVTFTAPIRGRVLHTGDAVRDWDYCRVWSAARKVTRRRATIHYPRRLVVSIPLTQAGAVYLDEQEKTFGLSLLLAIANQDRDLRSSGPFRSTTDLLAMTRAIWLRDAWPGRHRIVALADPAQSPPMGALGYYGDGAAHGVAAVLSASGKRLFIERKPGDVLHTNVSDYMSGRFE